MSDSAAPATGFLQEYLAQARMVAGRPRDSFLNRLYFAHAISLMEKYLSDLLIKEIESNPTALRRLAGTPKFHAQCLPIPKALNISVKDYVVHAMRNEVWHRLNDVKLFYRAALDVDFHIPAALVAAIEKRHHIIHRNGVDLEGNAVVVSDEALAALSAEITRFLKDIDGKFLATR